MMCLIEDVDVDVECGREEKEEVDVVVSGNGGCRWQMM
jgi:hypothetical protein